MLSIEDYLQTQNATLRAPDDPRMDELAANDKAVHEENAQQQQHAAGVGHHNVARGSGYHPEDADTNLVGQEQQSHEHEESAAPGSPAHWLRQEH